MRPDTQGSRGLRYVAVVKRVSVCPEQEAHKGLLIASSLGNNVDLLLRVEQRDPENNHLLCNTLSTVPKHIRSLSAPSKLLYRVTQYCYEENLDAA